MYIFWRYESAQVTNDDLETNLQDQHVKEEVPAFE